MRIAVALGPRKAQPERQGPRELHEAEAEAVGR